MAAAVDRDNLGVAAPNAEALLNEIAALEPDDLESGGLDAVAMALVDAVRGERPEVLRALADRLDVLISLLALAKQSAAGEGADVRGQLSGFRAVTHFALQRTLSERTLEDIAPGSHAHSILRLIGERQGLSNGDLVDRLGLSESEVSRVGRRISNRGLARKRRLGTNNYWEITPRGRKALELAAVSGEAKLERPTELNAEFSDLATAIVGTVLEAAPEPRERKEIERRVARTAGDMLRTVGAVGDNHDATVRFLDSVGSELIDVVGIVGGSIRVLLEAKEPLDAGNVSGLIKRGRKGLDGHSRLAKTADGSFVVAIGRNEVPTTGWQSFEMSLSPPAGPKRVRS